MVQVIPEFLSPCPHPHNYSSCNYVQHGGGHHCCEARGSPEQTLRCARSFSSDLFPGKVRVEWGMGHRGEEGHQGRSMRHSPTKSKYGSTPQELSETCRSLLDCPDHCLRAASRETRIPRHFCFSRAPRESNSD